MACATEELLSCQLIEISRRDSPDCEIEWFFSETRDEDSRQERHWVAVFLNKAGAGVSVEAFLEEGMVILSLSPATKEDIAEWKGTTQIEIPKCKFTKKEIYDTFLATEPMKVEGEVSRSCRKCIVAFLEKIGVTVPEDVRTGEARIQTESRPRNSAEENVPGTSSETQPVSSKEDTLTVFMEDYADKLYSLVEENIRGKEAERRPGKSAKENVLGTSSETLPVSSDQNTPIDIMDYCFAKLWYFVVYHERTLSPTHRKNESDGGMIYHERPWSTTRDLRTPETESAEYDFEGVLQCCAYEIPPEPPMFLLEQSEILQDTDDCIVELRHAVQNLVAKSEVRAKAEHRPHTVTQGIVPQTSSTTEAASFEEGSLIVTIWHHFDQLLALLHEVGTQLEASKTDTGGAMEYPVSRKIYARTGIPLYRGTMSSKSMQEVDNCFYVLKTAIQKAIAAWEATTKTEIRQRRTKEVSSRTLHAVRDESLLSMFPYSDWDTRL